MEIKMKLRFISSLVIISHLQVVSCRSKLNVQVYHNKVVHGFNVHNIPNTTMSECLQECLADCKCLSFQICAHECQLCTANKIDVQSGLMESDQCDVYEYEILTKYQVDKSQCASQSCSSAVTNCCLSSNPCQNGGTCIPIQSHHKRYKCQCKDGYIGTVCQQAIYSCHHYPNKNRISGNYPVLDSSKKPFQAFCDFESSTTWTLGLSYEFANSNLEPHNLALKMDAPKNQDTPSWKDYRLSKERMKSIRTASSKWRITCDYEKNSVNLTDYVRGLNKHFNIISHHSSDAVCVRVEKVDIVGINCTDCYVNVLQVHSDILKVPFNIVIKQNPEENCKFTATPRSDKCSEENYFGWYNCSSPEHRCSSSPNATTQLWFGRN